MALLALYGEDHKHPPGCGCAGCMVSLADGPLSIAWRKVPDAVVRAYMDAVYTQQVTRTDLHEGLFREHFDRLKNHAEAGWGKRFSEASDLREWQRFQAIERNLRDFAAHKQATITSDLRTLLTGKDGAKRSRADWEKEASRILKRHNGLYLRAEVQAATAAAQAAESWQHFERRKYLYPNLRYETAGDERVRQSHRSLDGVVRPVDDPFWDVYYPPNGWNCRCKVVQTDQAVTDGGAVDFDPPRGFRGNVGKTGKLFGDDHPYFDQAALDTERINRNAERLHAKISREEVRAWAKDAEFSISLPQLSQPVTMTRREVKAVTGKPHSDAPGRNALLYVLMAAADQLRYLGRKDDNGSHPQVRAWHYYGLTVAGIEYILNLWNIVLDDGTERIGLQAITDYLPETGGP